MSIILPNSYDLRLMSDEELKAKSEVIFNFKNLNSVDGTLESNRFGSTPRDPICSICRNPLVSCTAHSGVIEIPFPIVKTMCLKDFKILIQLLCPICSNFPLSKELKKEIMTLSVYDRISCIKKELEKKTNKNENQIECPECGNKVYLIKLIGTEPQLLPVIQTNKSNEYYQINPIAIFNILQNFKEIHLTGYSDKYHPKNFMTTLIPIVPNKLRKSGIDSAVSTVTSNYKSIIEELVPELDKIFKTLTKDDNITFTKSETLKKFNLLYDQLNAFYIILTDPSSDRIMEQCLQIISKRDRKHVDRNSAMLGRLKGKNSLFMDGVVASRHNDAGRTVLNGAPDSKITQVNVPKHIANILTMRYPVYEQNLKAMKQLVASMSNLQNYNNAEIPHVSYIIDSVYNRRNKITPADAQTKASLLKPGDKIEISLLDGNFVLHCRFPSMREESWNSLMVKRDTNSIITIPISLCPMKNADFDGDEAQIYCSSNTCYSIEALLLHSSYRMFIAYEDGMPIIWFNKDSKFGVNKITKNKVSIIKDFKLIYPPINVLDQIEKTLPKTLNYKDSKLVIENGKFTTNKTALNNKPFFKYFETIYGSKQSADLLDLIIHWSHDLNKNDGDTLGFEIKIENEDIKKQIDKIKETTYLNMCLIEQNNDPNKNQYQLLEAERNKGIIQGLLVESSKGTNIYNLGLVNEFTSAYMHITTQINHFTDPITHSRLQSVLAEGSRVNCAFPRYSLDPVAYGYCKQGYIDDIGPIQHFYDCKEQRKTLYDKGAEGIKKQGYLQKRLVTVYGTTYADYNGAVIDSNRLISLQYGCCGFDPRKFVAHDFEVMNLNEKEVYALFSDDLEAKKLYDEIKWLNNRYSTISKFITIAVSYKKFNTGFEWDQLIKNKAKKGKTDIKIINKFIDELKEIYYPKGLKEFKRIGKNSFNQHMFSNKSIENVGNGSNYITMKQLNELQSGNFEMIDNEIVNKRNKYSNIMKHRYDNFETSIWQNEYILNNLKHHILYFRYIFKQYLLTDKLKNEILEIFINLLVSAGEPIGSKASIASARPLSQAQLDSIHASAGGVKIDKVKRIAELERFEELLGGIKPTYNVITIGLYDDSKENTEKWAQEQETFYLSDIWSKVNINLCGEIDKRIQKIFNTVDFSMLEISPIFVTMIWDISIISEYEIHVSDVINKLKENYEIILFIAGYIVNKYEFKAFIYFKQNVKTEQIYNLVEEWSIEKNTTIIHGKYLKNCYVSENKNRPGHYLIEANEININVKALENLIFNPEIDPALCKTTNIESIIDIWGICEANARHYEELAFSAKNLSATSGLLLEHYKTISDYTFAIGTFYTANRNSIKKDEFRDPLQSINFEIGKDFLNEAIKYGTPSQCTSLVSSSYFGGAISGSCGDSISEVYLYEK